MRLNLAYRTRFSRRMLLVFPAAGLAGIVLWFILGRSNSLNALAASPAASESNSQPQTLQVVVAKPTPGGMERTTRVPATIVAFESTNLFAKVSGYLKIQNVDIGDHVREGQVLAELESPEYVRASDQAKAALNESKSQVAQADARILTAEADRQAAIAAVKKAKADVLRYQGARDLSEKQCKRIKDLYALQSVEQRLVDEQVSGLQSARSAEDSAIAGVESAEALVNSAAARVTQAKADAAAARSGVEVAEAAYRHAEVFVSYLKIVAPYNGVITKRNFCHGDYICSADKQGPQPILTVDRTDRMRVIVQLPDCDVPLAHPGAVATITIDALPRTQFTGSVSRVAAAEHSETRTMRAEVDLDNSQGLFCHGMYGYVSIKLPSSPQAMRIPLSAVIGTATNGLASVHVVKDGVIATATVHVGRDNGAETEVFSGLLPDDQIVVKNTAELANGTVVTCDPPNSQADLRPAGLAVRTTATGDSARN